MFDPKVLTEEKSLAQIAWRSRRIPSNGFNVLVMIVTVATATTYAYWSSRPSSSLVELDRLIASTGLTLSTTVLGFLIAGFTIFATLTKPSLFQRMAIITHQKSGLSYLKYNFFTFIQVFIHYLCYTAFTWLLLIIGAKEGPLGEAAQRAFDNPVVIKSFIARLGLVVLVAWSAYVLLILKSFVFNIFHVVMTAIRWEFEKPEETGTSNNDR